MQLISKFNKGFRFLLCVIIPLKGKKRITITNAFQNILNESKNVYTDKLDDIVNKFNNTYHSTIKKKPVEKSSRYIDSSQEITGKDPKFKIGDVVRI